MNWGINDWRKFAIEHLGLVPSSIQSATNSNFAKTEHAIECYEACLHRLLSTGLGGLLTTSSDKEMCGDPLIKTLLSPDNYLILGRSGLGKSHHAKHLGIQTIGSTEVPLFVDARHYRGDFGKTLAKSLSPCTALEPAALLEAVRVVGRSPATCDRRSELL